MKHFNFNLSLLSVTLASLPLVGCIDDKYDLSDIDTNVRVQVKDLEVPVNLDAIELSSIFDLDDESVIQEVNGNYAVLVDGDFKSDAIEVPKVNLGSPTVNPEHADIYPSTDIPQIPGLPAGQIPFAFDIPDLSADFEFSTFDVDKSIRSIQGVKADWSVTLNLSFSYPAGLFDNVMVKDLVLQLPKGLVTTDYVNHDGEINLGDRALMGGKLSEVIKISAIDFTQLNAEEFKFIAGDGQGAMEYKGKIGVKSGLLTGGLTVSGGLPNKIGMTLDPSLAPIIIDSFTGDLLYAIDGLSVSSVELNDLPDVLTDENTNIMIANPQLYLAINNPLANYGVEAHSGLTLTSVRPGEPQKPYSLPAGKEILIKADKGIAGPYNICLSPEIPEGGFYQGFEGASHVAFPSLSNVLSGKGLPEKINVDFDNARIGEAHVVDFKLGETLDDVKGNYTFYAPLAFNTGSEIVYSGDDDGWGDDTLDKLTVENLGVKADVENDLPFDITLTGWPVDRNGNQCVDPVTKKPVAFKEVTIKGGQKSTIDLTIDGTVVGVDGIHYEAHAVVDKADQTLRPTTKIYLTNIRAVVSGYYEDEL